MTLAEYKRKKIQALACVLIFINMMIISKYTGYSGTTYLILCLEIYLFFSIIINGSFSDILGKTVRSRCTKGQYKSADSIKKHTLVYQLVLGLLGTVLLFVTGTRLVDMFGGTKYSKILILLYAPLILIRTVSAYLSGCVKGQGTELPEAISVIIRQLLVTLFTVLLCNVIGEYGSKVSRLLGQANFEAMYQGIAVTIAILIAEIFVSLFLYLMYRFNKKRNAMSVRESTRNGLGFVETMKLIIGFRLPVVVILLLLILPLLICHKLSVDYYGKTEASTLSYGVFCADYMSVIGIIISLLLIPVYSIVNKLYNAYRKNENHYAKLIFQTGVHFNLISAGFWVSFFMVLAKPVADVFGNGNVEAFEKMLTQGSFIILTILLSIYFMRVLFFKGKRLLVVISLLGYDLSQILYVYFMRSKGDNIGELLSVGINLSFGVLCMFLAVFSYIYMRQYPDILQMIIVPVAAASFSGLLDILLCKLLSPHMGSLIVLIVCFVISFGVYWTSLLLVRNIREKELDILPFKRILEAAGQLLRVF